MSARAPGLSLIIPAYNEARRLELTLLTTQKYFSTTAYQVELIVVDDGSTDRTVQVAHQCRATIPTLQVIPSDHNYGKGHAVRTGIHHASGTLIGYMDADYKTPIEEIEKLLPWFDQGYDLVIGSRALPGSTIEVKQPLYRRLGSVGFTVIRHALVGLREVPDTQCGFKFFTRQAALDLFSRQVIDGYMFDIELLHLARRAGYRLKQVPIRWQNDPDTRFHPIYGSLLDVKEVLRIRRSLKRADQRG